VPVKPISLSDETTTVNKLMTIKTTSCNDPGINSMYLYGIVIKG